MKYREKHILAGEQIGERLAREGVEGFCRRTGAEYDPATGCLQLRVLDGRLILEYGGETPICVSCHGQERIDFSPEMFSATALHYLLYAKEKPFAGDWISPQELPAGALFFRGIHSLPTATLEEAFGNDGEAFRRAAEQLGGQSLAYADAAYEFLVFPCVKVAVLLWRGDEEFPPRIRFLVDRRISDQLALDAVLGVTQLVTARLLAIRDKLESV